MIRTKKVSRKLATNLPDQDMQMRQSAKPFFNSEMGIITPRKFIRLVGVEIAVVLGIFIETHHNFTRWYPQYAGWFYIDDLDIMGQLKMTEETLLEIIEELKEMKILYQGKKWSTDKEWLFIDYMVLTEIIKDIK